MKKLCLAVFAAVLASGFASPSEARADGKYVPPPGITVTTDKGTIQLPGSNGYCVNLEVQTKDGLQTVGIVDMFSQARTMPVEVLRSKLSAQFKFLALSIQDPEARARALAAAERVVFAGERLPTSGRYTIASCSIR
jgi:hypothetical protein